MPILSMFYGIIVRMYNEKGTKHNKPHIHCIFAEFEIVIALDGEILDGKIPSNKLKLIEAWMEIHKEELQANWVLLSSGEKYFKINPLS